MIGCSGTALPTAPITSTINNSTDSSSKEDLETDLSNPLNLDYAPGVDPEWDNHEVGSSTALSVSSSPPKASSTLRHDGTWASHSPAVEQHHRKSINQLEKLYPNQSGTSSIQMKDLSPWQIPFLRRHFLECTRLIIESNHRSFKLQV